MRPRVLIVAGEPPGDAQAARLAAAMLAARPDLDIYGVGGPQMRKAGVEFESIIKSGYPGMRFSDCLICEPTANDSNTWPDQRKVRLPGAKRTVIW